VESEEDIGDDCEEVTNQEDDEDTEESMLDKVELCRAEQYGQGQRYLYTSESITSGQSGDCLVYSQGFIYTFGLCTDHGLCTQSTKPCF
jgi:hypothetical protein